MKPLTRINLYVLTYSCNDEENIAYGECLGVYTTLEKAQYAMKFEIERNKLDGMNEDFGTWEIDDKSAFYHNDLQDNRYRIQEKCISL